MSLSLSLFVRENSYFYSCNVNSENSTQTNNTFCFYFLNKNTIVFKTPFFQASSSLYFFQIHFLNFSIEYTEKYDKGEDAGAAGLLGSTSEYKELDRKYVDQAEGYLLSYSGSKPLPSAGEENRTPTTAAESEFPSARARGYKEKEFSGKTSEGGCILWQAIGIQRRRKVRREGGGVLGEAVVYVVAVGEESKLFVGIGNEGLQWSDMRECRYHDK